MVAAVVTWSVPHPQLLDVVSCNAAVVVDFGGGVAV